MNDIAHAFKILDFLIYTDDTTINTIIHTFVRTTAHLTVTDVLKIELSMLNN